MEIALLIARGMAPNDVAACLWIAASTLQDHLKSIRNKTGERRTLLAAQMIARSRSTRFKIIAIKKARNAAE